MSDPLEYYVVRQVHTHPQADHYVKRTFQIAKFSGHREPDSIGHVRELHNGKWDSDDKGFMFHHNEHANKRIRIVKKHVALGQPAVTAYWHSDKGEIQHHTTPLMKL